MVRATKLKPLCARLALEAPHEQLLGLLLIGSGPAFLSRRTARRHGHPSPGARDPAVVAMLGTHWIRSGAAVSACPSALGRLLPLPAPGTLPAARRAAASTFFARLRSRRSLSSRSRSRFAWVGLLVAIRPLLSLGRAAAAADEAAAAHSN